jgi:hypothetical protein
MKRIITIFAVTLLTITICYAEEPRTVGVYKRHMEVDDKQNKSLDHTVHHMLYLSGVCDGYTAINKRRRADKQKMLYCQPDAETLNGVDYMRILEEALDPPDNTFSDQLPVAEAMLLALKEEFPCP